jgi:choline dehydrogenase-like flavoprotein
MSSPELVDVVVVGAGAAGGVYADRLAQSGKSVLVLEAGPDKSVSDMQSSGIWSRRHKWGGAPVLLSGKDPIAHNVSTGSGVGGAAFHHYATWPRIPPEVFVLRSRYGRGCDWGISYEDLQPWYDRVQMEVGMSGDAAQEPWRGPGQPYPMPPLRTFAHGELIASGFRRLGVPVAPIPAAINSMPYRGRAACLYDGWCDAGCPIGALVNPLVSYLASARARGARIETHCSVSRVLLDAKGRARGVEFYRNGERFEQPARLVVLAASFIQNPRILLCSGESRGAGRARHPGIANSSGLVGRYLSSDAMCFAYGLFTEPTEVFRGVSAGQFYHHSGMTHSERPELFGSYQWQIAPAAKPNDLFGVAVTRPDLYGEALHRFIRDASMHLAYMVGFVSGAPREWNRVELDSQRDAHGVPLARAIHDLDAPTLALTRHVEQQGLAVMRAAGARACWNGHIGGGHVSGGTIMGEDPARSVCDPLGRSHDIANLVIAGAGLFPQTGATSPTFTLHALAYRSAEHIATHWHAYT